MFLRILLLKLLFLIGIGFLPAQSNSPIGFFENKGQIVDPQGNPQPQLRYLMPIPGLNVQLHNTGFSYETFEVEEAPAPNQRQVNMEDTQNLHRIDIAFPGANPSPQIVAEQPLSARFNYYTLGTPEQGVLNVRQFRKVIYKDLYPQIDLEFQAGDPEKPIEYNFIVHPGGNPADIRIRYEGALSSKLENEHILLELAQGNLEEEIPHSFVEESGISVQVQYQKLGENTFGLQASSYPKGKTLVIDPAPVRKWATYFGGSSGETAYGMDVGPAGDVYIAGRTTSSNNIATAGAYQTTLSFIGDAMLAHFNLDGTLDWATYYGNSGRELGENVVVDGAGNLIIVGYTESTSGMATAGSFQSTYGGDRDGFMAKFSASGNRLWSTYLGGFREDDVRDVAIGPNSTIYVAGTASGSSFIGTSGTHQPTINGTVNDDAYLAKFDANGNLVYGTYYGYLWDEWGTSVAVDQTGNAYLAGWTVTSSNLATAGTHQQTDAGGGETFLAKFDNTGNRVWGTYFGGPARDQPFDLDLDDQGNIYMCGETQSTSGVATVGAHQISYGGATNYLGDAFATKFNPDGTLAWGTYYGGNDTENGEEISVDADGNVYLVGFTESTNNIASSGALQSTYNTNWDGFIATFDSTGQRTWGSYYGSDGTDVLWAVEATFGGAFYVAGGGQSFNDNNHATIPAHQGIPGSTSGDAILARFARGGVRGRVFYDQNEDCSEDSLDFGVSGKVLEFQPGPYYAYTTPNGDFAVDLLPGTYTVQVDTMPYWEMVCPINPPSHTFTVVHVDSVIDSLDFAITGPICTDPQISGAGDNIRPCFSNNQFHFQACNGGNATGSLDSAYALLDFGPELFPLVSTLPISLQTDGTYRVDLGDIARGDCVTFSVTCSLSCAFPRGQTVCVESSLFPVDTCALDSTPNPPIGGCTGSWDKSHLVVDGSCQGDSVVRFVIYNYAGNPGGNMACHREYRLYKNNQFVLQDTFQLVGGDSLVLTFPADGTTMWLETDQHPLHPGNPQPSDFVEACGDSASVAANWIPGLINQWPLNDADLVSDILCVVTTGSFDPNDKTGFPLGITSDHLIEANTDLEYRIRFQNTGTDTAFTVLIRDRLPEELDINSVISGASSHNYAFRIFGDRMLEWRFDNILLPDSNTNEPASNGLVFFRVKQTPDLPDGTLIQNQASIYFDFNAPIITNLTDHLIGDTTIDYCGQEATIDLQSPTLYAEQSGNSYQWIDCNTGLAIPGATDSSYTATTSGLYAVVINVDLCQPDTSRCELVTVVGVPQAGKNIAVYPNPAKDLVAIQLPESANSISLEILGLDGKLHTRYAYPNGGKKFVLPLTGLADGIYLIALDDGEHRQYIRLAIIR